MSKKCRNKGVSYFFCLVIDGSVVDPDPDPGSGSVLVSNGKLWIRIRKK
jgi:hypothetical protein